MLPYSGKFLRGPIFTVFADNLLTRKLNPQNELNCTVYNGREYTYPQKIHHCEMIQITLEWVCTGHLIYGCDNVT